MVHADFPRALSDRRVVAAFISSAIISVLILTIQKSSKPSLRDASALHRTGVLSELAR